MPIAGVEIAYRPVTYLLFDITGQSRQLAGGSVGIFYIISDPDPIRPPDLGRMPSNVLEYIIWHETCPVVMLLSREPMDINYAKVPYMCRRGGCHDGIGTFPVTNHGPDYPGSLAAVLPAYWDKRPALTHTATRGPGLLLVGCRSGAHRAWALAVPHSAGPAE